MSALAVDAVTLERMGVPVAAIGSDALVQSTGLAMARAHGYPDYPFVTVPHFLEPTFEAVQRALEIALPQVERILLHGTPGCR
jgi:hypothetical protein